MNYTKEFMLPVATVFVTTGTMVINTDIIKGSALLLIGVLVFVGRGFYKKYLSN